MKYRHNPKKYILLKKVAIRLTPEFAYYVLLYLEEVFTIFHDRIRFMRTYSKPSSKGRYQLEARMTYHAHALEKGLSHTDLRYGFGNRALESLADAMTKFRDTGYKSGVAYENALSVLREYIHVHESANQKYENLSRFFNKDQLKAIKSSRSKIGGVETIKKEDKSNNDTKNFKDLFLERYSVREFSDEDVDASEIHDAISIATKAPTVCNRQAVRVRVITDRNMVKKVLHLQAGLVGYNTPPAVLAVTVDNEGYVRLFERNQSYIDGGSFAMALLAALEYKGLAACSLNAMFRYRIERRLRNLLNIKTNENIIMFIAVGNFKDEVKVPKSFRYAGSEITIT